ncbi:MAG: shikimate kinase [Mycobacterium sp.]|nr:shikimate kinase [Mycobacterium sp.]
MAPKAVLVGLPGSGKSTIGRRLAKAMGLSMLDTDAAIEKQTGRTIADIFAEDGEPGFRRIEERVIRDALADHDGILSLGGGAVTTEGVREALAGHTVVYLEITAEEGIRRTGRSAARPLLAGPDRAEKYRRLITARAPLYRKVATIRVNTSRRNPGAVVRYLAARLDNPQPQSADRSTPSSPRGRTSWRRGGVEQPPAPPAPSAPPPGAPAPRVTPATLASRRTGSGR